MLTIEDMNRITKEVTLGMSPRDPDSPEQAKFREDVGKDIAKIEAAGGIVAFPNE
jgi:hypothetical protein